MAKSGDWGGNPGAIPNTVKRTRNVTKNTTSTVSDPSFTSAEEAPKLKFFAQAQYDREPFDPEFKKVKAKGTDDIAGSR